MTDSGSKNLSINLDVTNRTNAKIITVNAYDVLRTVNDVGTRVTGGAHIKFRPTLIELV